MPLHGGSPLREDDGGEGDPPASTVSAVILALRAGIPRLVCTDSDTAQPLTRGFHGLRPLNDGSFHSPRPRYRRALRRTHHLLSFRGSEATTLVSDANPAKRIAAEKEEQGSERSFRRKAEAEPSGLCDDAIPRSGAGQCDIVTPAEPFGGFPRGARE